MTIDRSHARRFTIALSYAGEQRPFVGEVAAHLAGVFPRQRLLYDAYHDAELAHVDLDVYLPKLYREQSELIVIFLCPEYASKRWCKLEWRYIRDLIGCMSGKRIMLLRYGDGAAHADLDAELGMLSGDAAINYTWQSPQQIAEQIYARLRVNQGLHDTALPLHRPSRTAPALMPRRCQADITHIASYAQPKLIGREDEIRLLSDAWALLLRGEAACPRILSVVARGGEGKTALVATWVQDWAAAGWAGCERAFAWSFCRQVPGEQVLASSDAFLHAALLFFGDRQMADSARQAGDKAQRLAEWLNEQPSLLILDGVEALQCPQGKLQDEGLHTLLKALAANRCSLYVLSSRYAIPELAHYRQQKRAQDVPLMRLAPAAGVALLSALAVKGAPSALAAAVAEVQGHALTLHLLGAYLRDAHDGDIGQRHLLRLEATEAVHGGQALRVMASYVDWFERGGDTARCAIALLRLLGLFDRPASADCLHALLQAPAIDGLTEALLGISEAQCELALTQLQDAKLLTLQRAGGGALMSVDTLPLLREYFAHALRITRPEAWRAGHGRLYDHLCANTPYRPDDIEGLQPLYQAVAHGCLAGLQQAACVEVYRDRILRGNEAYSITRLGAFGADLGAIAGFFESPWSQIAPMLAEGEQSWLLSQAAYTLRALGRLDEALEPMRAGLARYVRAERLQHAAITAGNLSELALTLGEVSAALRDGAQSVRYADSSGDAAQRMIMRTAYADALQQAGRWDEAAALFREAEALQVARQPGYTLLYSQGGFRYGDLFLTGAERAAWAHGLGLVGMTSDHDDAEVQAALRACDAVDQRATHTLQWVSAQNWLLDIALDQLSLGRAALYAALLLRSPLAACQALLQQAVDGLRAASAQEFIPRSLLSRAWLRYLIGSRCGPDSAQQDLDEAWDIAVRGNMRLYLIDILLYRARLFGGPGSGERYPWDSTPQADLAAARVLIAQTGYLRRMPELEDAEGVIGRLAA